MGKRYTYFRMPNGKPYKGTDYKYAPVHILAEIGKTANLLSKGQVSWPGFSITQLQISLKSSLVIVDPGNVELNETDTWKIVWQAVVALVKKAPGKPVIPNEFLIKADESATVYFNTPPVKYMLVSSLSIKDLPSKAIRMQDCTISSLRKRGKKFPLPKALSGRVDGSAFAEHIKNSKYRIVKVSTEGRSIYDATEKALNSLHLLRGLWSLIATYGSFTFRGGIVQRKPLGIIHTGPIHTLHFLNGSSVDDYLFWYDPDFAEDQPIYQPKEGWKDIEKKRRSAMRRIATLEYKNDMEALLIRYANALDQSNTDIAFLQMWSILERITDTIGANYDETIKRTLWPFPSQNQSLNRDMLESLRYCRNRYVHSGKGDQESDQVASLIKTFVDSHLLILISNQCKVRSLEEYGKFLALPVDTTILEERKQMLIQALRIKQRQNT